MFKLLSMLIAFLFVALSLLALRQHRLELTSESSRIYDRIRDRNQSLLDQQVAIAKKTNPWAVATALQNNGVNTGDALRAKNTQLGRGAAAPPAVETDLVAPVRH